VTPVELAHDAYPVPNRTAFVVLHSLCHPRLAPALHIGVSPHQRLDSQLALSLYSVLAHYHALPVCAPNFRNHGHSPAPYTHHAMATNVLAFFATHDLHWIYHYIDRTAAWSSMAIIALKSRMVIVPVCAPTTKAEPQTA
jgi:hypothetical protein